MFTSALKPSDEDGKMTKRNRAVRYIAADRASPFGIWSIGRPSVGKNADEFEGSICGH